MGCCVILFAGSIIIFFIAFADKNAIVNRNATESWMSDENFTDLIEASFTIPQCVNIFLSDVSAGTEMIFKQFISLYEFEYILNGKSDGCDSFFLVAGSEENLMDDINRVVTMNSNVEILIVVDNDVNDQVESLENGEEGIFNASIYLNTNVNIVARNGLWTLGDNFLLSRTFKEVYSYTEMRHKKGIVDLEGEELQVTTFYNPPLCYLETTVNRTVDNIEAEVFTAEDGDPEFDGVELIYFQLFAERLNFTYTIRKPSDGHVFGHRNGSVWTGGIIGQMYRDETHFAFGGLWLSAIRNDFVNLTGPWGVIHGHFLVPRPKPHASFWALTATLSLEVWIAIVAILTAQSVCIYTRAWVNPRISMSGIGLYERIALILQWYNFPGYRSFANTWTETMARLVGGSAPRKIQCLKLECLVWHFFGVLMVTAYSCSLAAKLASRDYDKRIDTVRDFVRANLTWGRKRPVEYSLHFDSHDPYAASIPESYQHITDDNEAHEKILKGNYAIFGRRISSTFFPDDPIRSSDLKGYRLMRNSLNNNYATFAVSPWLIEPVNKLLLWMHETGLTQYHLDDVLYRRTPSELREVLVEKDVNTGQPRVLILRPLGAGFAIYLTGLFISIVIFYFELRSVRKTRSIWAVLLNVKKKRAIWQAEVIERKHERLIFEKFKRKRYGFDLSRKHKTVNEIRKLKVLK